MRGGREGQANHIRWHYTTGARLTVILKTGMIEPATAGVIPPEKPVVWFTESDDWEPTANKMLRSEDGTIRSLSREETAHHAGGLVRIGVAQESAPHPYASLIAIARATRGTVKRLSIVAEREGSNVDLWYFSTRPVDYREWLCVDRFAGGVWVPMTGLTAVDPNGVFASIHDRREQ